MDTNFLNTATVRQSYADLVRASEDLSDFDCYVCHEKGKPPPLRYDTNQNLIIPKEHSDIVMGHGSHGRNNNCFNCHNETNLDSAADARRARGEILGQPAAVRQLPRPDVSRLGSGRARPHQRLLGPEPGPMPTGSTA